MNDPLRRRLVKDPDEVLAAVTETTGQDRALVERLVDAFRIVIDDLLADNYVVLIGALFISFGDSPTRQALRARLASSEEIPDAVSRLDHHAIAVWLDLDFDVYAERPLANDALVVKEVLDLLGEQAPDKNAVWDVLEAWDSSFEDSRPYKVSTVGMEAALERWLVANLDRLTEHGLPVSLEHRQRVLPSGRRPDLVCRFTDSVQGASCSDWLVIELKATRFYEAAADQVSSYVVEVQEHWARSGEHVYGLLITDGADHSEVDRLRQRGIAHLSVAALGYRMALAQDKPPTTSSLSADPPRLTDMGTLTDEPLIATWGNASDLDGPETYWVRLFWDRATGAADEEREREVASALWAERERRRERYEQSYGLATQWPAQHPTTVIEINGARAARAAVCIHCDWVTRPADLDEGDSLHVAAKAHALAHPHDPRLEQGINPTKRAHRLPGLAAQFDLPRANPRRAARRVAPRLTD